MGWAENEEGEVISVEADRRELRCRLRGRDGADRLDFFEYQGGVPKDLRNFDQFFASVLMQLELHEVRTRWPASAQLAALLLSSELTIDGAACFDGMPVLHEAQGMTHVGVVRAAMQSDSRSAR